MAMTVNEAARHLSIDDPLLIEEITRGKIHAANVNGITRIDDETVYRSAMTNSSIVQDRFKRLVLRNDNPVEFDSDGPKIARVMNRIESSSGDEALFRAIVNGMMKNLRTF